MAKKAFGTPKGMRDFDPQQMSRRNYIFDTIKNVYKKYGFQPIETPAMENLNVLTGKYGEEGDQLLFKVLNSGDFAKNILPTEVEKGSKNMLPKIAEKGLKYDLTVPFARFVAQNRQSLPIPFKRYQIQPVWRADRPQKGRYREFYQCDGDVVGSKSLVTEAEIMAIIHEVMEKLKISGFQIKLNHRQILQGICDKADISAHFTTFCMALDKLDKIGADKVKTEWVNKGIPESKISILEPLLQDPTPLNDLNEMAAYLEGVPSGEQAIRELMEIFDHLKTLSFESHQVEFNPGLARGLNYYTGAIYEVKVPASGIGSIAAGGRYDDLTAMFGGEALPGIGVSFGVDRIYDVMEVFNLFPEESIEVSKVLLFPFDGELTTHCLNLLSSLRAKGIAAEGFFEKAKLKKVMSFADLKQVPYVLLIGSNEMKSGRYSLKNMKSGDQELLTFEEIIEQLK